MITGGSGKWQRDTGKIRPPAPAGHCGRQAVDAQADGQLLDRFLTQRDEHAFSVLLERHGPMVLAVCRRILGDGPDAEDAFQATFLVLIRRAREIDRRGSLSSWLYGVAHKIATRRNPTPPDGRPARNRGSTWHCSTTRRNKPGTTCGRCWMMN